MKSSIFLEGDTGSVKFKARLEIPPSVADVNKWVFSLAKKVTGLHNWQEILVWANLPAGNFPVYAVDETEPPSQAPDDMLRSALILSKSNQWRYLANCSLIFTRKRLERNILLIEINTKAYYGMD